MVIKQISREKNSRYENVIIWSVKSEIILTTVYKIKVIKSLQEPGGHMEPPDQLDTGRGR